MGHRDEPAADRWTTVDRYLTELLLDPPPPTDAPLPPHEVSPPQGALLELLARAAGARVILEIGTLGGYSTSWLARALPANGRLVTLEIDAAYAAAARARLPDSVEVVVGPALETLPRLTGPFDLIFIDADKRNNPAYLEWALELSRPGTLIVADNVIRGGAVADPEDPDPSVAASAPSWRPWPASPASAPRPSRRSAARVMTGSRWPSWTLDSVRA